ncbi:MAG: hypothetical protein AB7O73_00710, partial [Bacteroidia bacterium]
FFKNNGYQFAYSCKGDSFLWINDVRKFDILPLNSHLLISSDVSTSWFNEENGLERHTHSKKLVYADEVTLTGLYYETAEKGKQKSKLTACNLENGTVKFSVEVPLEFDWTEVLKVNDSILLIAASGLHGLNLNSGKIWSISDVTGENNTQKLIQSIINPNAFRVKQSSFLSSEKENVITQICSNILRHEDKIYFAGKTNLFCLSINGELNWKVDLGANPTSKSALFVNNGKLYMLNLGVANFKEIQVVYGSPFFMQLDLDSGKVLFNHTLPMFAYPVDFKITATDLVLAGKNNLYLIDLKDGRFYNEIDVNELRYGNFQEFVNGDQYYVEMEGYFVPLNFINDNAIYFHSDHGKVYGVEGGRIQYEYHESELYKFDKKFKGYKLIRQKFKTYVLNSNFELVAVLDTDVPATVVKDKLLYFHGVRLNVLSDENFK